MSDNVLSLPPIRLPPETSRELQEVVRQLEAQLRIVTAEFNRLTQELYEKHSTKPYFLPPNGVAGYKLVFSTRVDNEGRTFSDATWVP